jgi:hypothetical protein
MSIVPNEQVRYYNRLRNSVERQGALYKEHLSNVYIPDRLRSMARNHDDSKQQALQKLIIA